MSLTKIQNELKAPKNQRNSFGKYNYRSCEDIMEAVKPLLLKYDATLTMSDEIKSITSVTQISKEVKADCSISYVEATCMLVIGEGKLGYKTQAQAGIEKAGGMALPQAFGSASSYARKYALNAMFLIDDTKDADATNEHGKGDKKPSTPLKATPVKETKKATAKTTELVKLKKLCKDSGLKFADVGRWALAVKKSDIDIESHAKGLASKWDEYAPQINAWLIENGE